MIPPVEPRYLVSGEVSVLRKSSDYEKDSAESGSCTCRRTLSSNGCTSLAPGRRICQNSWRNVDRSINSAKVHSQLSTRWLLGWVVLGHIQVTLCWQRTAQINCTCHASSAEHCAGDATRETRVRSSVPKPFASSGSGCTQQDW